jgi:phage terminase Nu1 subunit (DNA packaging protein)
MKTPTKAKVPTRKPPERLNDLQKLRRAKTRESEARASMLEMERRQAEGELVTLSEVQSLYQSCLLPIRQTINSLPSALCARVNPTDPDHARIVLQDWVDSAVKGIREKLPKVKAKG